jgi:hypothetical protein
VLAARELPVLLLGETGVGKEVFARALHAGGPRPQGPFVALNCGGLPRDLLASELFGYVEGAFSGARRTGRIGRIEAAHGGTLFLDEIGEMPLELQPSLLRVLEDGEVYPLGENRPRTVNFRLVAASHRDLRAEVAAGRFRMDLFYRVAVTSLVIPALRERQADIPALVAHFSRDVARRHGLAVPRFEPAVLRAFATYAWPGISIVRHGVTARLIVRAHAMALPESAVGPRPVLAGGPTRMPARPGAPRAHTSQRHVTMPKVSTAVTTSPQVIPTDSYRMARPPSQASARRTPASPAPRVRGHVRSRARQPGTARRSLASGRRVFRGRHLTRGPRGVAT